jgi:hypothetical protein
MVEHLGTDIFMNFIIPSFRLVNFNLNKEKENDINLLQANNLELVIKSLENLSNKCPYIAEKACRSFLKGILSSTRSSMKEFIATITTSPIDNDDIDLDYEKIQNHRLVVQSEEIQLQFKYQDQNRSKISKVLLKRWLQR